MSSDFPATEAQGSSGLMLDAIGTRCNTRAPHDHHRNVMVLVLLHYILTYMAPKSGA